MPGVGNRTVLVTGSTSGIGLAAATRFAQLGASIVVHGPDDTSVAAACDGIERVRPGAIVDGFAANLAEQDEVRRLAAWTTDRHPELNVLVNNAAAVFDTWTGNGDGIERTFAVNYLAPYLLTRLLLPTLEQNDDPRIVVVGSEAHRGVEIDFGDLQNEHDYERFKVYARSKLADLLFNVEMARRLDGSHATINAMHPGTVKTTLFRPRNLAERIVMPILNLKASTPQRGADTIIWLAAAESVAGSSGGYYASRAAVEPSPAVEDEEVASRIWRIGADLTGLPD